MRLFAEAKEQDKVVSQELRDFLMTCVLRSANLMRKSSVSSEGVAQISRRWLQDFSSYENVLYKS